MTKMKTVCNEMVCSACKACSEICPKDAIRIEDTLKNVTAVIDEKICINCGLCRQVCPTINPPSFKSQIRWYQGWNLNMNERSESSSGGFAYCLAKKVVSEGGYAAACKFKDGDFEYNITGNLEDIKGFMGSKYVKSNPAGVYRIIKALLEKGNEVLFIGLPCHVAALKSFLGDLSECERLITVDLICHGTPSKKTLIKYLDQYNIDLCLIKNISFRKKGDFRIAIEKTDKQDNETRIIAFTQPSIRDRYTLAFLYGLTYTDNCYKCAYARVERISDITIGDSWGSELNEDDKEKGISLALCQTEKGLSLLERCEIELKEVNIEKAITANHQLCNPVQMPICRELFFESINQGKSFNHSVRLCYPEACFRLDLKNTVLRLFSCFSKERYEV